jgi:F-type H+-transporting ATPase subunit c
MTGTSNQPFVSGEPISMTISKWVRVGVVSLAVLLLPVAPVVAQEKDTAKEGHKQQAAEVTMPQSVSFSGAGLAAGLGMGLTIIGAGLGLGKIGASALEAMARQPEVAPRVQTAMIIVAAMLEGATLASVALCFVVGLSAKF